MDPVSPVDCRHPVMLFVQSSRGGPPDRSEYVSVCRGCGEFTVRAQKDGVHTEVEFTLPTWRLVAAAGQYALLLDKDEADSERRTL